jgi:hypothetical protein
MSLWTHPSFTFLSCDSKYPNSYTNENDCLRPPIEVDSDQLSAQSCRKGAFASTLLLNQDLRHSVFPVHVYTVQYTAKLGPLGSEYRTPAGNE